MGRVELVKTHSFTRKHATGKAKIELHVLQVERGMSWEAAEQKKDEAAQDENEGYFGLAPVADIRRRIPCDVRDLTKLRPKAEAEYRLGLTSSAGKLLLVHVARRADMSV